MLAQKCCPIGRLALIPVGLVTGIRCQWLPPEVVCEELQSADIEPKNVLILCYSEVVVEDKAAVKAINVRCKARCRESPHREQIPHDGF